ncbi:hypothetical protein [Microbacterium sp. NPDC055455]
MCCCNCNKAQTFTITVHAPEGLDEETIARIAAERAGSLWRD